MKWIELKYYLYSRFIEQIKRVEKQYITIIKDIEEKSNNESIKELEILRQDIRIRIIEIDAFIERHFDQEQVLSFEKGRFILRRLMTINPQIKQTEKKLTRKLLDDIEDNDDKIYDDDCPCYNKNIIPIRDITTKDNKQFNRKINTQRYIKIHNTNSKFSNNTERHPQSNSIYNNTKKISNSNYTTNKCTAPLKSQRQPLKNIKEEIKDNKTENDNKNDMDNNMKYYLKNDYWKNEDNNQIKRSQSQSNLNMYNTYKKSKPNKTNSSKENSHNISSYNNSKKELQKNQNKSYNSIPIVLHNTQLRELSFCFKLNEAEYRLLQKEKAKRVLKI